MVEAPVLLIVFNRPETTQKVFDAIKKSKPQKLYIAGDAPRLGNTDDEKNCTLVKDIVKQVDWDCETHYRFSDVNQGCGPGPFNAISWVFEKEDKAIILEDDCVPSIPFFRYCDDLLNRYKYDTRIWFISGNQYNEEAVTTPHSYFFSRYGITWGWATWKRCWEEMDMSMSKYPLIIEQNLYKTSFRTNREADFFQKKISEIFHDKSIRSHIWDTQWGFTIFSNGGLCILPRKNLVTNIGYRGVHSVIKNQAHDRPIDENFQIISHPEFILCDVNFDTYQFDYYWNKHTPIIKRIIRKIQKQIGLFGISIY